MLNSLVVFLLILWVALMPDRLGYDEEEGGSRRIREAGYEAPPPTPPPPPIAKAGVNDGAAISAVRNAPSVKHLSTNLVI